MRLLGKALVALALAAGLLWHAPARADDVLCSPGSYWSENDASNNQAAPNGWTTGTMDPNQVEPAARMMMGALKRQTDLLDQTYTTGGTAPDFTLTTTNTSFPYQYCQGLTLTLKANQAGEGFDTLAVNSLAALNIYVWSDGAAVQTAPGDIQANVPFEVTYDAALDSGGGGWWLMTTPQRPGMVLLGSATASNTPSINFKLPSGYVSFELDIIGYYPTSGGTAELQIQFSANNCSTFDQTDDYYWIVTDALITGATGAVGSNGPTSVFVIGSTQQTTAISAQSGFVKLMIATNDVVANWQMSGANTSPQVVLTTGMGMYQGTTPDCFQIYSTNSTNIAAGKFALYGLRTQ